MGAGGDADDDGYWSPMKRSRGRSCGADESRWRVCSGRKDDHGSERSPDPMAAIVTTAAIATTTADDERLVRLSCA